MISTEILFHVLSLIDYSIKFFTEPSTALVSAHSAPASLIS